MSPKWDPDPDVRKGRSVVYNLHAHLVFVPKYRRGVSTDELLRRCEQVMREVRADLNTESAEFNGEADHVRLPVRHPPQAALSRLVDSLKGVSARPLRQEHPGHIRRYLRGEHSWSPSYLAASRGGAPLAIVKEYIENQKRPGQRAATRRGDGKRFPPSPEGPGSLARYR